MSLLPLQSIRAVPRIVVPLRSRIADDREVQNYVRGLFGQHASRHVPERRKSVRHLYPYPIDVTPLDGEPLSSADKISVLGKQLSEYGLDFYSNQPLPYRRVIAWFETSDRSRFGLLTNLTWCRFNKFGWYENGGRFLQVVRQSQTE